MDGTPNVAKDPLSFTKAMLSLALQSMEEDSFKTLHIFIVHDALEGLVEDEVEPQP